MTKTDTNAKIFFSQSQLNVKLLFQGKTSGIAIAAFKGKQNATLKVVSFLERKK